MPDLRLTPPPAERPIRRRTRRDPVPRFKPDRTRQLDAIRGCPELQVPADHVARAVRTWIGRLDLRALEATYSSLGRRGYPPRALLAVWVYASLIGVHHSTKLARLIETDAACRLLTGGHAVRSATLRAFRQRQGAVLLAALEQSVALARQYGLLRLDELAVDSLRLRAHASMKAVRTLKRSTQRVAELEAIDAATLSPDGRAVHAAKLQKHRAAIAHCVARAQPSVVTTNGAAALMKFPQGAGLPGHRVTVTASGVQARLVVGVLIDADTNDYGKLEAAVQAAQLGLRRAGVPPGTPLDFTADAGYAAQADLAFAAAAAPALTILVDCPAAPEPPGGPFGRDRFVIHADGTATCPAGRRMRGPTRHSDGRTMWKGDACAGCPLRPQCTPGEQRTLTANLELERVRAAMRARRATPEGRARYNQRMATVEPVFANIEDAMGFRRASARHGETILAEVLLKLLAHNISRLIALKPLSCVYVLVRSADPRPLAEREFSATL